MPFPLVASIFRGSAVLSLLIAASACMEPRGPEDWKPWFDEGSDLDVREVTDFTDAPYDFPLTRDQGIGAFVDDAFEFPRGFGTNLDPSDYRSHIEGECAQWYPSDALPREIEGIVTIHPRLYIKTSGCTRDAEKYYGSFFLEDSTGGVLVLGDSKVAHFDMGDRVRLRVRATRRSFGVNMVYASDILSVDRIGGPVAYEMKQEPLGDDDVGRVRRVTGTVVAPPDTFGEVLIDPDGYGGSCSPETRSECVAASLDVELNRRGVTFEPGDRVTVTGPVLFAYDTYSIILMRIGQIEHAH